MDAAMETTSKVMPSSDPSPPSSATDSPLPAASAGRWYASAMEQLVEVVQDLSLAHDLPAIMAVVRRAARELTGADGATFVLRDGDKCFYAEENAIEPLWKGQRFPMSLCISGWVMLNREAAVIEDIYADARIPAEAYRPTFVRSLAMVPIRTRDPVGAIGNYWATPHTPTAEEVKVLAALADTTAVAMEHVRLYSELEQRARDMAVLTQAAPLPIVAIDADDKVMAWNPAAEQLFGRPAADVLGHSLPGIDPGAAADCARMIADIRSGRPVKGETLAGRRADGTAIDLRLSGAPIRDEDGRVRVALLAVQDETERNKLERQFLHAQKMEAIGQLTGGIAHDFNNLLGILIGNLDLVRERVEDDSEAMELIDAALEAGLRGADLNKRLLAFSRRQALQPEEVDVNAAVAGMVKLLRRSLGERIDVRLALDRTIWPVHLDPVQFETAVMNLGVNARDAMPQGGILTIEARNVHVDETYASAHEELNPGDYVMVAMSDSGEGIPPAVLRRVFDPFFTTKPIGKGTGLGLSMVYGFMKQSGGHVNIYSEPGAGTTVRLYLPRHAATRTAPEETAPAPATPAAHGELVLLVEDNPDMRRVAHRQLLDLGYRVQDAETGDRALAMVEGGLVPDLLFADILMPGALDGIDLADRLRDRMPGLAILLCSGFTERAILDARERAGHPVDYPLLAKPYRKDDLAGALRRVLDGRTMRNGAP
jgi:PAS domain S-box-containing protein